MMETHRLTFRKEILVPTAGSGDVHVPTRVWDVPGTMVALAVLTAPAANGGYLYPGWRGASAVPGKPAGTEIAAGDSLAWHSPIKDERGNWVPFDLYDLFVAGDTDGDALMVVTW